MIRMASHPRIPCKCTLPAYLHFCILHRFQVLVLTTYRITFTVTPHLILSSSRCNSRCSIRVHILPTFTPITASMLISTTTKSNDITMAVMLCYIINNSSYNYNNKFNIRYNSNNNNNNVRGQSSNLPPANANAQLFIPNLQKTSSALKPSTPARHSLPTSTSQQQQQSLSPFNPQDNAMDDNQSPVANNISARGGSPHQPAFRVKPRLDSYSAQISRELSEADILKGSSSPYAAQTKGNEISPNNLLPQPANKLTSHQNFSNRSDITLATMPSPSTSANEKLPLSPTSPHSQLGLITARDRLSAYMKSNSFSDIKKSLNFNADLEMLLRSLHEEWFDLADPQRMVAKAAILQLFAGLFLASQRAQDGSFPPSYFLWFASTALVLWDDLEICNIALRIAAESGVMALDSAYMCFLIQKMTEDVRNSSASHKRTSGVSDMAAFRRWTSAAVTLHEKALLSLKRFFRSATQANQWNLICSTETDRHLKQVELKSISDMRMSLDGALLDLSKAETAYTLLLSRYGTVPDVQTMVTSFKRQFFRDTTETANGGKHATRAAAGFGGRVTVQVVGNTSSRGVDLEGGANTAGTGPEDTGSQNGSQSQTSLGSGLIDTPKQLKLGLVTDAVNRVFNKARLWSFLSMFIVIAISTVLFIVVLLELKRVNRWIEVLMLIASIFNIVPESCVMAIRPVSGTQSMSNGFFRPVQQHVQSLDLFNVMNTRGASATGPSRTADEALCVQLLTDLPQASLCSVAYYNLPPASSYLIAKAIDPSTGLIVDNVSLTNTINAGVQQYKYKSYLDVKSYFDAGSFVLPSSSNNFAIPFKNDYIATPDDKVVIRKYTAMPIIYAPNGASGAVAANPPLQGLVVLSSLPNDNDLYIYEFLRLFDSVISDLETSANSLQSSVHDLHIQNVVDLISGDFFSCTVYGTGETPSQPSSEKRSYTFQEGIAFLSTAMKLSKQTLMANWDTDAFLVSTPRYNMMEFCTSNNVVRSFAILDAFQAHLRDTIKRSQIIISICACVAVFAALTGATLTGRLIRSFLREYDRSDSVSPPLAMVALLPKVELKKVSKAFSHLRVDRGIFDPDDEQASFLDLKVSKSKQRYQDALLRARQIALERDRELQFSVEPYSQLAMCDNEDLGLDIFEHTTVIPTNKKGMDSPARHQHAETPPPTLRDSKSRKHLYRPSENQGGKSPSSSTPKNKKDSRTHESTFSPSPESEDALAMTEKDRKQVKKNTTVSNVANANGGAAVPMTTLNTASAAAVTLPAVQSFQVELSPVGHKSVFSAGNSLHSSSDSPSAAHVSPSDFEMEEITDFKHESHVQVANFDDDNFAPDISSNNKVSAEFPDFLLTPKKSEVSDLAPSQASKDERTVRISPYKDIASRGSLKGDNAATFSDVTFNVSNQIKKGDEEESQCDLITVAVPSSLKNSSSNKQKHKTHLSLPSTYHNNKYDRKFRRFPDDDEDMRSASSAARSALTAPRRIVNAMLRRPISRSFMLIWSLLSVYVAVTLIICVISVGTFQKHYDAIGGLMQTSFHMSVVSVFAAHIRRGDVYRFATTPFTEFGPQVVTHTAAALNTFFGVIDTSTGKTTVGRANDFRTNLLYTPNCLSLLVGIDCATGRSFFETYVGMTNMQQGLVRSVLYWTDYASDFERRYNEPSVVFVPASDPETWYMYDALKYDLEYGLSALRTNVASEAESNVQSDETMVLFFLAGGLLLGVLSSVAMEYVIRTNIKIFKSTALLLKILPARLLDDYKLMDNVLSVKTDDEEAIA
eukprot:GDKJ01013326.1.p1 GENE.GDKJ01013326.1~~GDKJ01013326.1.p1  ORF type:complete len:1767 (+),score=427.53 GDKJ01013326.1:1254-6554(+)